MPDGPSVGVAAEPQGRGRMAGAGAERDGGCGGGLADGVAQQVGGEERSRGLAGVAGVEADYGVEVDDAACLVLRDLDVPDGDLVADGGEGKSGQAGEVAGQVGGEPAPQVGGVGVEQDGGKQDGGGVVVAVGAERLAEARIVYRDGDVGRRCRGRGGSDGRLRRGGVGRAGRSCRACGWRGRDRTTVRWGSRRRTGCVATVAGMPLPPASPARTSWRASRL